MRLVRLSTPMVAAAAATLLASLALAGPALASPSAARTSPPGNRNFQVTQILNGMNLQHTFIPVNSTTPMSEPLTQPDDITVLGHNLFTGFQNGVGPQGEPSTDGNTASTVVEFTTSGQVIQQWDIHGKCDGLTADAKLGVVIATVNEDANSSLDTIRPGGLPSTQIVHYSYNEALPHSGGTDAISIFRGHILISASAPGTTGAPAPQPTYPAVYSVSLEPANDVATVSPVFYDESYAQVANVGTTQGDVVRLGLTDPDSNEVVPASAPRFGRDFMLTSQGDQEQIFLQAQGRGHRKAGPDLAVLSLSESVDDTAWARARSGAIFGPDANADTVDMVTGPFQPGTVFVAVTPCDANDAPSTCPGPGFPPNYLGSLNPWTGNITPVTLTGPNYQPKGLVFVR
jgi:hypothetical protein